MVKNIVNRIDRNLARRLREARQEAGLSTRAVAALLPKRLSVSHTTIASYEKGVTSPDIATLGALATLYQRTLNWFLENRSGLSDFRYLNLKSRSPLNEKRLFEASAGKWMDAYVAVERHLKLPLHGSLNATISPIADPQKLAVAVRTRLSLDVAQPIQNVVSLLESFAVRVMELQTSLQTDGLTARHEDTPVLILNSRTSNDRIRMSVAHELAHFLFEQNRGELRWTEAELRKNADAFACELLLPSSQLELAFREKSFIRLIEFKERFGISLAAMIFRAEALGIIKSTTSRWLCTEIIRRGWKQNEPGFVWRDRANRFEAIMESALHTGRLTWRRAEEITGIREGELQNKIAAIYGDTQIPEENGDDERPKIRLLHVVGE